MAKTVQKEKIAFINASVLTMDKRFSIAWGILTDGDKVEAVLPEAVPKSQLGKRKIIDCMGNTVIPGFMDIHCHVKSYAENFISLDLSPQAGVKSMQDIKEKILVHTKSLPIGTWVKARNYDEFHLKEKRHPNKYDLDEVSPSHPVKLTHRTGMVHVLNSLALKLVGITTESEDPVDGLIERDQQKAEPTGVLYGMGKYLSQKIPGVTKSEIEKAIRTVSEHLVSLGITTLCDTSAYNRLDTFELFTKWKEKGLLVPRVKLMLGTEGFEELRKCKRDTLKERTLIAGIKIVLHEATGKLSPDIDTLITLAKEINREGYALAIHAFDEHHIMAAAESIGHTLLTSGGKSIHRIEHCAVCPPHILDLIKRFQLSVVSQPSFLYFNGDRYLRTIPDEQLKFIYPFRSIIGRGIPFAASSDFPIVPPNPFISIYSMVTRKTVSGTTLNAEETTDLYTALRAHTSTPATILGESPLLGSLTPGKIADIVVLNADLRKLEPEELKSVKVLMTVIGGKTVYMSTS